MNINLKVIFESGESYYLPMELINIHHTLEWLGKHYPNVKCEIVKVKNG